MYKSSRYNFIWPVGGTQQSVLFNSYTTAVMEIQNQYLHLLDEDCLLEFDALSDAHKSVASELIQNQFLIDASFNELSVLKHRNNSAKYNKETLSLTLMPTFNCNLNCFYCFQDRSIQQTMDLETQKSVIAFTKKSLSGAKRLNVCWFGGEPLLEWSMIEAMTKELMTIAEDHHCDYSASIITNGYLFDESKYQALEELKVKEVQITLDGPSSMHGARKGLKGSAQENFEQILDVIHKLQDLGVKVAIRVNIDKDNADHMEQLFDELKASGIKTDLIHPAQLREYRGGCVNGESACLHTDEFAKLEVQFYSKLLTKGMLKDFKMAFPRLRGNFCGADQTNSFTIGPDGYIFKCWDTVGDINQVIWDTLKRPCEFAEVSRRHMRNVTWITWSPFELKTCENCKLLPICMGGCPQQYYTSDDKKPECLTVKNNLETIVMNHYFCTKINSLFSE